MSNALSPLRLALVAGLVAVLAPTSAAPAQFGQAAGFGEMMTPYFLRRDLVLFAEHLDLDDGQNAILESLFWDYEEAHEAGKTRMLERLQSMREEMKSLEREQILQLVFAPFEERSEEWETMRTQFLENAKAILSPQQLERWPSFRRTLRREKELPKGRLSGESIDLFHVLKEMDLEPTVLSFVDPVMAEYETAIDTALDRRERLMHDSRIAMMHSIRDERPETAIAIYEQQIDARVALRDVNDQYREAVTAALPYDVGATFRQEVLERAYPRVYRPTAAQRLFREAKDLDDLDPEILKAVIDLENAYLGELATINDRIVGLIREFEPEEARYRANSFAARSGDARPPRPKDPSREEFRRRDELGRRYIDMLRGLLTPDQFASLRGAQRFNRNPAEDREAGERVGAGAPTGVNKNKIKGGDRPRSFGGKSGP